MNLHTMALLVGLASTTLTGCCCWEDCEWGKDPDAFRTYAAKKVDNAFEGAGVDAARQAKAREAMKEIAPEVSAAADSWNRMRAGFVEAWNSPKPDSAKLHGLVDEWTDRLGVAVNAGADAFLSIHRQLTPAEREAIAQKANACPLPARGGKADSRVE